MIVLGGAGFIGSTFAKTVKNPIIIDKLTYAGDLRRLKGLKYKFYKEDIYNISSIFNKEKPDIVINFAAETHVDRSIKDSTSFIKTNVLGVQKVIDACRKVGAKYIHISTDEVYGETLTGSSKESDRLNPGNPYSASKAAADLLIKSYHRTYGFPYVIIRPCNTYGPFQNKEKFIPRSITNGVTLYGDGSQIREWLYVDDCVRGIHTIINKGISGIYNLGSGDTRTNKEVSSFISNDITYIKDRPGHDKRYCLNSEKISSLGWEPKVSFIEGIKKTKRFYLLYNTK